MAHAVVRVARKPSIPCESHTTTGPSPGYATASQRREARSGHLQLGVKEVPRVGVQSLVVVVGHEHQLAGLRARGLILGDDIRLNLTVMPLAR